MSQKIEILWLLDKLTQLYFEFKKLQTYNKKLNQFIQNSGISLNNVNFLNQTNANHSIENSIKQQTKTQFDVSETRYSFFVLFFIFLSLFATNT